MAKVCKFLRVPACTGMHSQLNNFFLIHRILRSLENHRMHSQTFAVTYLKKYDMFLIVYQYIEFSLRIATLTNSCKYFFIEYEIFFNLGNLHVPIS